MAKSSSIDFIQTRHGSAALALVILLAAYIIGSRALDTGSLQQYFLVFLLTIAFINRAVKAIKG